LVDHPEAPAAWSLAGIGQGYNGVEAGSLVCYLDSQAPWEHGDGEVNPLGGAQAGVLDAVGHDLGDGERAALDYFFCELATKPVERAPCSSGGVEVRCE
jgi:hypothetical protein